MVGHKGIPRARKNFPLMDFITLSTDETNRCNIKFCPRAIWLNMWMSRAKNTFIDLGIRIYLHAFQKDISVHLEVLVLVWGWMAGDTGLITQQKGSWRSSDQQVGWLPTSTCAWRADTLRDVELRSFRAGCWRHKPHSPCRARNFLVAEEIFAEKWGK